jgi:hypothetical protein
MRPVQILTLAVLFRLFGLEPLGYHLVNTGLLGAGVVLCYRTTRSIGSGWRRSRSRSRSLCTP